jgi:hypothetical protein
MNVGGTSARRGRVRHSLANNVKRNEVNQKAKGRMRSTPGLLISKPLQTARKDSSMTSIGQFESNVYSEEIYSVTEQDFDEVMQMMAEESEGFQGYGEWSQELEQGQRVMTAHGEILINKECSHSTCTTTRCEKGATYRGIAI